MKGWLNLCKWIHPELKYYLLIETVYAYDLANGQNASDWDEYTFQLFSSLFVTFTCCLIEGVNVQWSIIFYQWFKLILFVIPVVKVHICPFWTILYIDQSKKKGGQNECSSLIKATSPNVACDISQIFCNFCWVVRWVLRITHSWFHAGD